MRLINAVSVGLFIAECHAFPTLEHLGRLAGDQVDTRTQEELHKRAATSANSNKEARASFSAAEQLIDGN